MTIFSFSAGSDRRQSGSFFFSGNTELPVVYLDYVISFPRITILVSLLNTPPVELFGGVLMPSNIWINCNNPSVEEESFYSTTISNCLLLLLLLKPQTWSRQLLPLCHHATVVMRTFVLTMV
jgi:hypothetical protein